jgi:hypothetical protein
MLTYTISVKIARYFYAYRALAEFEISLHATITSAGGNNFFVLFGGASPIV